MENTEQESFQAKGYLSPSQIDIVKNRLGEAATFAGQRDLLTLIDDFVRSNGTIDESYNKFYSALKQVGDLCSTIGEYPPRVSETLALSYGTLYYDFLILTGVVTEEDIRQMQEKMMEAMGQSLPHPPIAKA